MPDINFALLDAAIEDAANSAGGIVHNQAVWVGAATPTGESAHQCGTAMCLAGFIAVREGAKPPSPRWSEASGVWWWPDWTINPATLEHDEGSGYHVADFAAERVGLTSDQATEMFAAINDLDDLRVMRDHLREHPAANGCDLWAATCRAHGEDPDDVR